MFSTVSGPPTGGQPVMTSYNDYGVRVPVPGRRRWIVKRRLVRRARQPPAHRKQVPMRAAVAGRPGCHRGCDWVGRLVGRRCTRARLGRDQDRMARNRSAFHGSALPPADLLDARAGDSARLPTVEPCTAGPSAAARRRQTISPFWRRPRPSAYRGAESAIVDRGLAG